MRADPEPVLWFARDVWGVRCASQFHTSAAKGFTRAVLADAA
jgi:hypothetical protein